MSFVSNYVLNNRADFHLQLWAVSKILYFCSGVFFIAALCIFIVLMLAMRVDFNSRDYIIKKLMQIWFAFDCIKYKRYHHHH